MKHCPKCGFKTAEDEMLYCPQCSNNGGNGKVWLEMVSSSQTRKEPSSPTMGTSNEANTESMKVAERVVKAMSATETAAIKGDANAVSGDVTSNYHDERQQWINIEQKELSEAERYRQNTSQYYNTCVELIKDGFIDDDGKRQLNALRHTLGLNKDIAEYIQKEAIEESAVKSTTMSGAVLDFITRVKRYIELNNKVQIQASFVQLEAYHKKIDNDHLDYIYFQLKAILYPNYFLKDYSTGTTSYWEAFWSYVALARIDNGKAAQSLANLVRWDSFFPYQNQSILQTIGLLMQDKVQEARETYTSIITGYSDDLEPVRFAVSELLDQHWDEVTDVSPQAKFYVESLFRRAYDQIMEQAKERKAEELAAIHQKELEAQAIQDKKGNFILQYEAKKGSISDALILSGVTQTQYDEWRRYDANFRLSLENVDKRLAKAKEEEIKRIEDLKNKFLIHYESDNGSLEDALVHSNVKQEQFDDWKGSDSSFRARLVDIDAQLEKIREEGIQRIKEQKERFLSLYKDYACDIQRACDEIDISPEIVKSWQNDDPSFHNSICYIKREHDKKRRKKILSVVVPSILIVALSTFIIITLNDKASKQKQTNADLKELYEVFDAAYSGLDRDVKQLEVFEVSLTNLEDALNNIRVYEEKHQADIEPQYNERLEKAILLCEDLHNYYLGLFTTTLDDNERQLSNDKLVKVDSAKQRLELLNN